MRFVVTTNYKYVDYITMGEYLTNKEYYRECYFVMGEDEDPLLCRDYISPLHEKSQKIFILKFENESSEFIQDK